MPDPAQLTGNFSNLLNAAGQKIPDLRSGYQPADGTAFVRDLFPGNVIPANRLSPIAAAVAKYWPAPNTAAVKRVGCGKLCE